MNFKEGGAREFSRMNIERNTLRANGCTSLDDLPRDVGELRIDMVQID